MVDTTKLNGNRRAEFERDREESNRRYDHAFRVVLSHTSSYELKEFWRLFSTSQQEPNNPAGGDSWSASRKGSKFDISNPMNHALEREVAIRKQKSYSHQQSISTSTAAGAGSQKGAMEQGSAVL